MSIRDRYDAEMRLFQQSAEAFSKRYPEIAQRLHLTSHQDRDPHIERLIESFDTYKWKKDAQGNITDRPEHEEESDIMDGLRYLYQNAYGILR